MMSNKLARFKPIRRRRRVAGEPESLERESIFFTNFRALALLCKLFGTFNVEIVRESAGYRLKHKWFSLDVAWSVCVYAVSGWLLYAHDLSAWNEFLRPFFYSLVATSVVLCIVYDKYLPELMRTIEQYDAQYRSGCILPADKFGGYKSYLGKLWALVTALGIVLCTLAVLLAERPSSIDWPQIGYSFIKVITGLQRHIFISTFAFFCYYLTQCFRDVRTQWVACMEMTLAARNQCRCTSDTAEGRLERVRLLHCRLTMATRHLNECYGTRLAFYLAWFFIEYLLDLYELVYITPLRSNNQIFFTIYHVVIIALVATFAGNLTAAGSDVGVELSSTQLTRLSEQCQLQVQMFFNQLTVVKLEVEAAGFCTLNRGILVSLLMSVMTYFIVIVQFAPQLTPFTDKFKNH